VKALVERRAIAGVFITDHNVRGRKAEAIKADIDMLQAIRKEQGLPPLIIAADQEGGAVSRLSPPLKRQPSLGSLIAKSKTDEERRSAVEAYAVEQAAELTRLGVTLNFGPVVDLNLDPKNRSDGETRLRLRAISADPYTVAKVAGWYCDTLAEAGVMCTLKHFPGLGRVRRDTHVASAQIDVTEGTLELNDWVPFRRTMDRPNAVTMMGHVRVGVLDKSAPASYSQTVIGDLVRKAWNYDGLIVTDDFSMGAITRGKPGIGPAAVKALNAGTDVILVSFSEKHLDTMMSALLAADEAGEIDHEALARSRARLDRILSPLAAVGTN
jgi:beta-N-acetylhexosaminidase